MDDATFQKEIGICRESFQTKGKCNWGKCDKCGVIPLLYKLAKGEIYEEASEVERIKKESLQ